MVPVAEIDPVPTQLEFDAALAREIPAGVAFSGLFAVSGEAQRRGLPAVVGRASAVYRRRAAVQQAADLIGQLVAGGLRSDAVGRARLVVVVGDDGADELAGVAARAATHDVHAVRLLTSVLRLREALVEVGGVGVAAAGHGDVQQCAGGVFAEHRVGRVGGAPWAQCTVTA